MPADRPEMWAGEATGHGSAAPTPGGSGASPERAAGTSRIFVNCPPPAEGSR
ncbi:hypothetical protein IL992_34220 [Microbispora sp. NEAU-D428]|uniref:hypothetical protein n=1 Tax=Microbispora sitophila TaxID=2771537 RepID=UPI0018671DAE|nr:hypothetical protein [Microbispora sitophila]MBE3014197.1 hypothetical protein [Microbispora sitophila]